ncbi:hypothetical protein [Paraburkholderia sp. CI3]
MDDLLRRGDAGDSVRKIHKARHYEIAIGFGLLMTPARHFEL